MPVPAFIPVIGSGFDATAAQQFQLAQFNRAQEEANIARQNQAARDYNQWAQQNALLGREDARYADSMLRSDEQSRYGRAVAARNMAESQRQFDVGAKLQAQHYANEATRWKAAEDERKRQETQTLGEIESAAQNLAPEYNDVRKTVDDYQAKMTQGEQEVITSANRIYSGLKPEERAMIVYDGRRQFKPIPIKANDPKALEAANTANALLAEKVANYDEAAKNFKFYQTRLAELHRTLGGYRLLTKKDGDNYVIISPLHNNKVFKGMVEEAKKKTPFVPATATATAAAPDSDREDTPDVGYIPATATATEPPPTPPAQEAPPKTLADVIGQTEEPQSFPFGRPTTLQVPPSADGPITMFGSQQQAPEAAFVRGPVQLPPPAPVPAPATAPKADQFQDAPADPAQRVIGQVYMGTIGGKRLPLRWVKDMFGQGQWANYNPAQDAINDAVGKAASYKSEWFGGPSEEEKARQQDAVKEFEARRKWAKDHPGQLPPNRVRVVSPDGKTGSVPTAQLGTALKSGFMLA